MAITRQLVGDISVFTAGGTAILATASNVVAQVPVDLVEGRGVAYRGKNPQAVKQEVIISTTQYSNIDSCTRVANVDISLFEIGTVDFLTHLRGGSFRGSHQMEEIGGIANFWKYNMPTVPDYQADFLLNVPNSLTNNAVQDIMGTFFNATIATAIAARNLAWELTINSVAMAVPMICQNATWQGEDGRQQLVKFDMQGKDCNATYPTTPTGTTSILEKAFVAPGTPITIAFTPKSANSGAFSGEFVFDTFGFSYQDASLIATDYSWRSHGPVTFTAN